MQAWIRGADRAGGLRDRRARSAERSGPGSPQGHGRFLYRERDRVRTTWFEPRAPM